MGVVIDYTSGFFEAAPTGETVGSISGNATLDLTSGNVFSHTPTANTTFAFSNPPASGTGYDFTLKVTGANVASGYDLANASYDSVSFSVSAKANYPAGLWFKPDGTKMYTSDPAQILTFTGVIEYNLSTAWDITTATHNQDFDVSSSTAQAQAVVFKDDGTKMYLSNASTNTLYQYSLSTPWDISTTSYDTKSLDASTQESQLTKAFFKPDGTKVFLTGGIGDAVYEYALSTAWDISTSTYVATFSVSSQEIAPSSLFFTPDGTKMFLGGVVTDAIYQYSLSTAWDLSTSSYDNVSFSLSSQDTVPQAVFFKPDGSKMYVSGAANDTIFQYSTSGTAAAATFSYPSSVKWAGGTAPTAPANGETDVYSFFTTDGGTTYYGFQAGDALA